ncbi:MAG: hypothetical protein G01um101430_277 [Parcubacteria group bacterium Gr01-1014_30]|nr:MAG: hypothetical protein G01um101430_277 [Parcubacteria group bacterium Gr01-1014_30]
MEKKAWVVSVNMGYGHQRTAFPLRDLAQDVKVINANDYEGIPAKDRKIWEGTRRFYEAISRFSRIPVAGKAAFAAYDRFQRILSFYPKRNLSKPNFALKQGYSLFKKGWGKHLIEELRIKNKELRMDLPIISTFSVPAFAAEFFDYPGEIFCVICDADVARGWAPLDTRRSRIKYLAPTQRTAERMYLYGVPSKNVFLTGYPLPLENIGSESMEILKDDLRRRLLNLDPQKKYCEKYEVLIESHLGKLPDKPGHPLTLMFSLGGAGAQKEIGVRVLRSLWFEISQGKVKVFVGAGISENIKQYFEERIRKFKLKKENIEIIFAEDIESYFTKFNQALRETDVLWTKPSELSFYSALGIPIIISRPIGSQEEFNRRWLLKSGFGLSQEDPSHTNQWLFDWLQKGYLAEAAMEGFIEGEKLGTYNIKKVCCG